jgi:hypothetical protein
VVEDERERGNAENYLQQLMELGRMPAGTRPIVVVDGFEAFLEAAPEADICIFGLQAQVNLAFMQRMMEQTKSSCIFVRDSGYESALV